MESSIIKPEQEYKTISYIVWCIVTFFVLAIMISLTIFIPDKTGTLVFGSMTLVCVLVMACLLPLIPATYRNLEYAVTDEAVIMKRGIFWKKRATVPYKKITNIDITQGPLQRKFNIGSLHIQTAGAGGAPGAVAEIVMDGIRDLEGLKNTIMANVAGYGSSMHLHPQDAGVDEPDIQNRILDELTAIRRILETR